MGHPRPVMVALGAQKHLRLMLQSPEGFGVDYPVRVPLKAGADSAGFLLPLPSERSGGPAGPRRQETAFKRFPPFPRRRRAANRSPISVQAKSPLHMLYTQKKAFSLYFITILHYNFMASITGEQIESAFLGGRSAWTRVFIRNKKGCKEA